MSIQDPMALLCRAERDQLEQVLMDFEDGWSSGQFAHFAPNLSAQLPENVRAAALIELIKVDLQRGWRSGQGRMIETYLAELAGSHADTLVTPQLLAYEYQVRSEAGHEPGLPEYQRRFPKLFDEFSDLLQHAPPPSSITRNTKGPSAVDTHPKQPQGFDQLPVEFGRYRVLQELGAGAMGKVYLAHDTKLDRQVALKTPSFRDPNNMTLVARFEREARAAAKLQHRNICQVFDVGEINGRHFISMAYIEGRCLTEYISSTKLPNKRASTMLIFRLAQALREAHDQNVVHRDLKPGNIMVDQKHEPIVMDFGLALQIDDASRMTNEGTLLGSPAYMSPEQIQGKHDLVGPTTDIYALGVIFYELLTGKLPFQGSSIAELAYKITSTDATRLSEVRPDISAELEAIVEKMIAKEPSDRFASMADVAQAIRGYLTSPSEPSESDDHDEASAGRFTMADQAASNVTDAAATPQQTQLLRSSDRSECEAWEISPGSTATHAGGHRSRSHGFWLAFGGGAFLLLLLGIVLLTRTPYGTLRIETVGDLEGLQVLIDGQKISLNQANPAKAINHKLQLKIGGALLELDPQTDQFILPTPGKDRLISVTAGGVRLANERFTVAREGDTILKIELLDDPRPNEPPQADSAALADAAQDAQSMERTSAAPAQQVSNDPFRKKPSTFEAITIDAPGAVNKLAVAPDGKHFVATGSDTPGDIIVWETATGRQVNRFHILGSGVSQVMFSGDGKAILVSGGAAIHAVDPNTGEVISTIYLPRSFRFASFPNRNWVACLYYSQPVANARKQKDLPPRLLSVWDWEKGEQLAEQVIHSDENAEASYPAVSSDGKFLTLGLRHSHIRFDVEDTENGVFLTHRTAMEKTSLVRSAMVFSSNGRFAATSRKHGQSLFAVVDIHTGKILHELDRERASDQGMGCQMAFAADGRRLVVADMEGGVSVWDAELGTLIKRMHSHQTGPAKYGPPDVGVTRDNLVISAGGTHDRTIVIDELPEL